MKNNNLEELTSNEVLAINGGSELSDLFWWGVGRLIRIGGEVSELTGSTGGGYAGMGYHHSSECE